MITRCFAPAAAAALLLCTLQAQAGDFQTVTQTPEPATATRVVGANNPNTDKLYLDAISISFADAEQLIPTSIQYNAIATSGSLPRAITGSGTLSLLDSRVSEDIEIDGEEIGHLYDFVFRDSRDNTLVFGTRVTLGVEPDQDDDAELNFIYRRGLAGSAVSAAWLFQSDSDLRLYNVAMTDSTSLTGALTYVADVIRMQSDINLAEGNPYSGLFLVKTDALSYTLESGAIGVFQAGEEGQPQVGADFLGFAPVPVPEPSSWLMLGAGLAALGFKARRSAAR